MDQYNYIRWNPDISNNAMILANDEFIIGIDPLNGDQLWKIKEHKNKHIRPFDNNLFVGLDYIEKESKDIFYKSLNLGWQHDSGFKVGLSVRQSDEYTFLVNLGYNKI